MDSTIVNLFGENGDKRPKRRIADLSREADFEIGKLAVHPAMRTIAGPLGEAVLEPKVMQVLIALGREPGAIYSRDDLLATCWDGRIVGDAAINRVISLLRSALRDASGEGVTIKTIARVGYRIEVDEDAATVPAGSDEDVALPGSGAPGHRKLVWAAGIAALLLAVGAVAAMIMPRPGAPVERLTIAMLPIAADSERDALLARGLESELREEVARSDGVSVTASVTAQRMAEADSDPVAIAQALGADYVWDGRLLRGADNITLDARLVSAGDGAIVWQERFASDDSRTARLPLRAARSALLAIGRPVDESRSAGAISGEDFDLYLTARGLIRTRGPEQQLAAIDILRPIIARNPEFSGAHSALAKAILLTTSAQAGNIVERQKEGIALARRAQALDPASVEALKVLGMFSQAPAERHGFLAQAVDRDPGDSEAWLWLSHVSAHPDFGDDELRAIIRTAELDPLWSRAWQASWVAAEQDSVERARQVEQAIMAASTEQWQRDAAQGRLAAVEGDLSEMYRLTMRAMPAMTTGQRQVAGMQLRNAMLLLGLDLPEPPQQGPAALVQDTISGRMPPWSRFEESGLAGRNFWAVTPLTISGPRHMIAGGRGDELLALYDESLGSPAALAEFASENLRAHHFISNIAIHVGFAMKQAGRDDEARELFDLAERSVARWRANDAMTMTPLSFEANLAVVQGQDQRAIDAVEKMIGYGWPYVVQSPGATWTGPLLDNPIWARLDDDPRLRRVLDPVRRNIARERAEVLVLLGQ